MAPRDNIQSLVAGMPRDTGKEPTTTMRSIIKNYYHITSKKESEYTFPIFTDTFNLGRKVFKIIVLLCLYFTLQVPGLDSLPLLPGQQSEPKCQQSNTRITSTLQLQSPQSSRSQPLGVLVGANAPSCQER